MDHAEVSRSQSLGAAGEIVYLDTSFMVSGMMQRAPGFATAATYTTQLVANQSVIVLSDLHTVEMLQALVAVGNDPTQVSGSVRRRYRLQRWGDDDDTRRTWLNDGFLLYQEFYSQFASVIVLTLSQSIADVAIEYMAQYKLKSADAIHLAFAVAAGATALATVDRDFSKVIDQTSVRIDLI